MSSSIEYSSSDKDHHRKDEKGFSNPWDSAYDPTTSDFIIAWIRRLTRAATAPGGSSPPNIKVHTPRFLSSRSTSSLRATWLGHATVFIEMPSGLRVLFDPVLSPRFGPLPWLGPKRFTEAPCQVEDIPFIDAVIISHNHFDHLDYPTIKKIIACHPKAHFFVPLQNMKWFTDSGAPAALVTELDWWTGYDLSIPAENAIHDTQLNTGSQPDNAAPITARIECLPCQHSSGRGPGDKCRSLWASWSISSGTKTVWFSGDTGYRSVPSLPPDVDDYGPSHAHAYPSCPAFRQIGQRHGPFDLGLIPIGAYNPRALLSGLHANPFDSVNIFRDTRCRRAMAVHWGTWHLTEEEAMEPPVLLREALRRAGLPERGVFDVYDPGESREFE